MADLARLEQTARRARQDALGQARSETAQQVTECERRAEQLARRLRDLEQTITSQLGLRVQLRTTGDKKKGRLIIHYASLEQFDRVVELLGVRME